MSIYKSNKVKFDVLTQEGMEKIHEKSLELLETVGIRVDDKLAEAMLLEKGAKKRDDDGYIQVPRSLVQWAMEVVPKTLVLYDRDGNENMRIEKGSNAKYFGSMADGLEFLDPETKKVRPYEIKDSTLMLKLGDYLDCVNFVLTTGIFHGPKADIYTEFFTYKTMTEFSKTMLLASNTVDGFKSAIEMLQIVAGGKEKLIEKPFAFIYTEPIPPFIFPVETTQRISLAADAGLPVISMPYSMMGGTSPMSKTMALIQNNAEILAGLVFTQLYREGNGYFYASMPTILDMHSTIGSYAAPEFHINIAAAADMSKFYGLPFFGTAGASDSRSVDIQASCELTMEIMSSFLGKSDIIHDLSFMDHSAVISPEYFVLAQEVIEMINAYVDCASPENDEVDMSVYEEAKKTGHYLEAEHTFENMRDVRYSKIFSRQMENPDESEVAQKLKDKIDYIMANHKAKPLDESKKKALDEYIAKYDLKEELAISEETKK